MIPIVGLGVLENRKVSWPVLHLEPRTVQPVLHLEPRTVQPVALVTLPTALSRYDSWVSAEVISFILK